MIRFIAVLICMVVGVTHAHAQAPNMPVPGAGNVAQGIPPAGGAPVEGAAPPAQPGAPQAAGQGGEMGGLPPSAEQAITETGVPGTQAEAAAPDRQAMMRELQEQGREAAIKARQMQATDPAGARKVMQDYYQMRHDKMKEIEKAARTRAAEQKAQKREQAKARETAVQAQRAAATERESRTIRDKGTEQKRSRLRDRGDEGR